MGYAPIRRLTWVPLIGLFAFQVPVGAGASDAEAATDDEDCRSADTTPFEGLPAADVNRALKEIHAAYAGLPGFVDVYYYPDQDPAFRAAFVRSAPDVAALPATDFDVGIDFWPEEPTVDGPGTTPTAADLLCQGIRPGSLYGPGCTLNFVYTDGAHTYMGTAGHCVSTGQSVIVAGIGNVGTVVFSTGNAGLGNDFALVRISPAFVAFVVPEMCDWGGPTAAFTGATIQGAAVVQTGHGSGVALPVNLPARPKAGVGVTWGATSYMWAGATLPGDSGSPVALKTGEALGTHTHRPFIAPGVAGGTRWDHGLDLAAAAGFTGLSLVTVGWTHP